MPDYLSVIVVDFDDTICAFTEDFVCRTLIPGAKEALLNLQIAGYTVVISSARNNLKYGGCGGKAHRDMAKFLDEKEVPYDRIDPGTDGKPVAYRYIDDKGVGCPKTTQGEVDWDKNRYLDHRFSEGGG